MSTATTNGRPRKQLSDQLDRLDGIIDCLADGLPEAVRDAVRDGARAALKDLVADVLADPETLARLRKVLVAEAPATPVRPRPSRTEVFLARVRTALAAAAGKATTVVQAAVTRVRRAWSAVRQTVGLAAAAMTAATRVKRAVGFGLVVGLGAVVLAASSHPVAVALSGIGTAGAAAALHFGLWARRVARRLAG